MRPPRWYRGTPPWLWGLVIALALAVALWLAGTLTVRSIRAAERMAVLREGDRLMAQSLTYSRVQARLIDSLTVEAARRDTVWLRAKAVAQAVTAAPIPTDSTALVTAVRSCRATLDATVTACDSAQAAQRAVIPAQTQRTASDSAALAAQAVITAGITRRRDAALAALAARSRWRTVERSACAVSVAANVIQWRAAR